MQLILPLKHWQLFVILLFFIWLSTGTGYVSVVATLIMILIFLGWIWSIGTYGQKRFAAKGMASKNMALFTFNIIYLFVFTAVMMIVTSKPQDLSNLTVVNTVVLRVCQAFTIFALLHSTWFAARTLSVSVNNGKSSWETTIKNVFYLLLPVIGVWEIQPIVNKWSAKYWYEENDDPKKSKA